MATDIAPLITGATYPAVVEIPEDGETITESALIDFGVALGDRIEFIKELTAEASDNPEQFATLREEFWGAIDDPGVALYADLIWRRADDGTPSVNHNAGNNKNPGQLRVSLPGNGADFQRYEFHLGSSTGVVTSYNEFQELTVVLKITEDPANLTELVRFGLVDDADLENGGSDCVCVFRQPATSSAKWQLLVRKAGVQTLTAITAADFDNGEFAVWKLKDDGAAGIDLYLNGTLVHNLDALDRPTGGANLSFYQSVTAADTEVMSVHWDLVAFRSKPTDRSGA